MLCPKFNLIGFNSFKLGSYTPIIKKIALKFMTMENKIKP